MDTVEDLLLNCLSNLSRSDLNFFKDRLSDFHYRNTTPIPRRQLEEADTISLKNCITTAYGTEDALDLTIQVLRKTNLNGPADELEKKIKRNGLCVTGSSEECLEDNRKSYMVYIKKKYQYFEDVNACLGEATNLSRRYRRLLMTRKHRDEKEREDELKCSGRRHLELMESRSTSCFSTSIEALFDRDEEGLAPQIVVLQGPAGIGKTMTAKKIMLDWASGRLYRDQFHYLFYFCCTEITQITHSVSLADLISQVCGLKCQRSIRSMLSQFEKILFIIDGFDELKLPPGNGVEEDRRIDVFQKTSKEVLLSKLLQNNFFHSFSVIITTRPLSLTKLQGHVRCPHYVEILGFTEQDRKDYISNFFKDRERATRALGLIMENETLFTMCFVPIVCWIVCTNISQMFQEHLTHYTTSTSIYISYIKSLLTYHGRNSDLSTTSMKRLCRLANEGVWDQKIIFQREDLQKHELVLSETESVFLNEYIFQKGIEKKTCYGFIHQSVQAFFAALHYRVNDESNSLGAPHDATSQAEEVSKLLEESQSQDILTLTVRFMFGLANKAHTAELPGIRCQMSSTFKSVLEEWPKRRPPKHHNEMLHCLYETQDEGLVRRMMSQMSCLKIRGSGGEGIQDTFTDRIVSYCLEKSVNSHTVTFKSHTIGKEGQKTLYQGLQKCSKLVFKRCELMESCRNDLRNLIVTSRSLKQLVLVLNKLEDSGAKYLCEGLENPRCVLEELTLLCCDLTAFCCIHLQSVLIKNRSLVKLNLSGNNLNDEGIRYICEGLKHPDCVLQELWLASCGLTFACCEALQDVIVRNRSLTTLKLSGNKLQDSGAMCLCEGLNHPDCTLEDLRLVGCELTPSCCMDFCNILTLNQSLTSLDLSGNTLKKAARKSFFKSLRNLDYMRRRMCVLLQALQHDIHVILWRVFSGVLRVLWTSGHAASGGTGWMWHLLGVTRALGG